MEQRRVRLGDIVDDYCTRERRVTNHAVVAIIEDQIQLTRCTTCDTEHPYKAAKVPRRRKKTETGALYEQVLAGRDRDAAPDEEVGADSRLAAPTSDTDDGVDAGAPDLTTAEMPPAAAVDEGPAEQEVEDGPVRRPLIRATLPRPEGQPTVRQPPDFTIRQSAGRAGFRQDPRGRNARLSNNGGRTGHQGAGQNPHGHRGGFGQGRSGAASHQFGSRPDRRAGETRHNRPSQHARSGKKRSR